MLINWLASISFLAMGWFRRCKSPGDCGDCNPNETPQTIEAVVAGFANNQCTDAGSINGTFTLTKIGACTYRYIGGSASDWNGSSCDSHGIVIVFVLGYTNTTVTITVGGDVFSYSDSITVYGDCCSSDLASPLNIPFLGQITSNPDYGHDGFSSTVSVKCLT